MVLHPASLTSSLWSNKNWPEQPGPSKVLAVLEVICNFQSVNHFQVEIQQKHLWHGTFHPGWLRFQDLIISTWNKPQWIFPAIPYRNLKKRFVLTARVYALRFVCCFFSVLSRIGKLLFWPKNPLAQPTSSGGKHIKSAKPQTFFRRLVK